MKVIDLKAGDLLIKNKEYEKAIRLYLDAFEDDGKYTIDPKVDHYNLIAIKLFILFNQMVVDKMTIPDRSKVLINHIYDNAKVLWGEYPVLPMQMVNDQIVEFVKFAYKTFLERDLITNASLIRSIKSGEEISIDVTKNAEFLHFFDPDFIYDTEVQKILCSPNTLNPLSKSIIANLSVENFFTELRSIILKKCANEPKKIDNNIELISLLKAISINCFMTEYSWFQNDEEIEIIEKLYKSITERLKNDNKIYICEILILSSYKLLHEFSDIKEYILKIYEKRKEIKEIVKAQIIEIDKEIEILDSIENITPIEDEISLKVQNQYEIYPYPRWSSDFQIYEDASYFHTKKNQFPLLEKIDVKKILVAGCGTGQHPISIAAFDKNAEIHAIDLSKKSISYGIRKAEEYGIKNIKWFQADLLELKKFNEKYDAIESCGVLHHMQNPKKGFDILTDMLNPQGIMKIGLYSRAFRDQLKPIKNFIKDNNLKKDINSIRQARKLIMTSNIKGAYFDNYDFYSVSSFIDLFMHEQELDFNIIDLENLIQDNFNFMGFTFPIAIKDHTYKIYDNLFSDDQNRINLRNWDILENDEKFLFRSMYNFIIQKNK
tara:strand:- start:63 stop:1874 length:1812 start_codon:yes stop_codon:yes gene_type:complete